MNNQNTNKRMKWGAALLALVLAVAIPVLAVAEAATQEPAAASDTTTATADTTTGTTMQGRMFGRGGNGYGMGGYGLNTSSLTDEQKAAYDSALALYEQVEDKVLADLVTGGVVAQADVDTYTAQRTAQKSLNEIDQSSWTADQYKAFYEANAKTDDERKTAMQALADAGQLTQAQADALSAQDGSDLWTTIAQNSSTNSAIQAAITTMQQARQTMNSTLHTAGIEGMGMGKGMFGGFCMDGKGFGQTDNQNQNGMGRMQGGMGGMGGRR